MEVKYKVSVAVITYNHEDYIERALLSVINQKTSFDFEIVIGDDCSNDATSTICQKFADIYKDNITYIRNAKNLRYINNLLNVLHHCTGEYIALLEADDYWVTSDKLQKQVNILERDRSIVLCFSNALIDDTLEPHRKQYFYRKKDMIFSLEDCLRQIIAPTSSYLFRRDLFKAPAWFNQLAAYEYMMIFLLAQYGGIYYLNECTSSRTQHYKGQSTTTIKEDKLIFSEVKYFNCLLNEFPVKERERYRPIVLMKQIHHVNNLFTKYGVKKANEAFMYIKFSKLLPKYYNITLVATYIKLQTRIGLSKAGLLRK